MEGKYAIALSCLVGLGLYFGLKRSLWEAGLASLIGFLGLGGLKPTLLTLKTLPRDFRYINACNGKIFIKFFWGYRQNFKL